MISFIYDAIIPTVKKDKGHDASSWPSRYGPSSLANLQTSPVRLEATIASFWNTDKDLTQVRRESPIRFSGGSIPISPGFIKTPLTDKNEFPMPFLKTPEYAAEKIFNGLVKSSAFEIHFPKGLTLTLKFLRILPYKLYLFLVDKLVKR